MAYSDSLRRVPPVVPPVSKVLIGNAAITEGNRLLTTGEAKVNPVFFDPAKAKVADVGGLRSISYGDPTKGGMIVTSPLSQESQNANAQNAAQLAVANLNNTKATLAPAESAADNAYKAATTGLVGQQASVVVPNSVSENAARAAAARLTAEQTNVLHATAIGTAPEMTAAQIRAKREAAALSLVPEESRGLYRLSDDGLGLEHRWFSSRK